MKNCFIKGNNSGFTLLEVLIAVTIFSVFITIYVASQGYNLADSVLLREEIQLKRLCKDKLNEVITDPPELRESLTLSPTVKTFDEFKEYEYQITWRRLKIPDASKMMGDEEDSGQSSGKTYGIQKSLLEKVTKNMEEMIWQVEVTVRNKETEFEYSLSTWISNPKAKIKIDGM